MIDPQFWRALDREGMPSAGSVPARGIIEVHPGAGLVSWEAHCFEGQVQSR